MRNEKISIIKEDPDLVELAAAISRDDFEIPIGIPSPSNAGTPGAYFGAIRALKYMQEVLRENEKYKKALQSIANSKVSTVEVWCNDSPCWNQGIAKKALGEM